MKLYRVKENGKIETATILERVDFNCYSTTYRTKYHTIIHYPLPNKFEDSENSIVFFKTKKEALKEYKKNIKEQGNKMKKIETWEDLKEAFKDNENISFETECINIAKIWDTCEFEEEFLFIKDGLIFTKNGNLLKENSQADGYYSEFWNYTAIKNRTYQQIYDIIKLMLE